VQIYFSFKRLRQAVSWISGLGLELTKFNQSRKELKISTPNSRNNITTAAGDIIKFFQEGKSLQATYVIDPNDLHLLPGFTSESLSLNQFELGLKLAETNFLKTLNNFQKNSLSSQQVSKTQQPINNQIQAIASNTQATTSETTTKVETAPASSTATQKAKNSAKVEKIIRFKQ